MRGDIAAGLRFAPQFWRLLRHPISVEEADAELHRRMASREENFLRTVREGVYANPRSPYRRLLQRADCEYDDIERMVRDRGLEPTLESLHASGVYVTFDEFKGRVPIERSGLSLTVRAEDFDNPRAARPYFHGSTGGSTGAPTRIPMAFDHDREVAVNNLLFERTHGTAGNKHAMWFSTPDAIGLVAMMTMLPVGKVPEKWFVPSEGRVKQLRWSRRVFVRYFILVGRAAGVPIPRPEAITLEQADVVARWAAQTRDRHGRATVHGYVSQLLRVALAAADEGLDLTGVTFAGSSEPPTPAKVRTITSTGARWAPTYWSTDAGAIGFGCGRPRDENDQHLQKDRLAMIQRPQQVPGSDHTVDAFCFTTLLPTVPKVLLNTETDDYGLVEQRSCGCLMEEYGLVDHIRHVRSYRKLTGEGITLVGRDIERILEEVLPARFGGSPVDYQLAEEEDGQGLTRLHLLISPRVAIEDEQAVVSTVLDHLADEADQMTRTTAALWKQTGTLRVRRQEPVRTGAGKLMPLHVSRQPAPERGGADREGPTT